MTSTTLGGEGWLRENFKEEMGLSRQASVQLNSHLLSLYLHFMPKVGVKEHEKKREFDSGTPVMDIPKSVLRTRKPVCDIHFQYVRFSTSTSIWGYERCTVRGTRSQWVYHLWEERKKLNLKGGEII